MNIQKQKTTKAAKTRCEEGPSEDFIPQYIPRAKTSDIIEFSLYICKANSQVTIYMDEEVLRKESSVDQIILTLPNLTAGFHRLYWNVFGFGEKDWQTRAEIKINGALAFLRRRTNNNQNPSPTGFWIVEIV
jgi:hypothetical protein